MLETDNIIPTTLPNITPQSNNPRPNTVPRPVDIFYTRDLYVIIGFTCIINFLASLRKDYKTIDYLLANSIIYVCFSFYIIRKKKDLDFFTGVYLCAILIIYFVIIVAQLVSGMYTNNTVCQNICPNPTSSPTLVLSSTLSPTSQANVTG